MELSVTIPVKLFLGESFGGEKNLAMKRKILSHPETDAQQFNIKSLEKYLHFVTCDPENNLTINYAIN